MNDGSEMVLRVPIEALRPSEYTSALIQALRSEPERVRGKQVLEIGSGSGVVLAVLGSLGAASVCGIDIEQDAIEAGSRLLAGPGHANAEFHRGDMWRPVAGRCFDLIVANLPNSPHPEVSILGRPPNWSAGGYDGRLMVDAGIDGLRAHLVPGGRALMTHNSFIGLDRSRAAAHAHGLSFDPPLDPGLRARREAGAHDAEHRAGRGRTLALQIRSLHLRRDTHRRVRRARDMRQPFLRLLLAVAALLTTLAAARAETPDEALGALLKEARQQCAQPSGRPEKILCGKRMRVGGRDYYPLFGTREGTTHVGYEPDIARAIAGRMGVEIEFVRVSAATRIPLLGEDRIDLVLATMGHTTQRDSQLRFIRPHTTSRNRVGRPQGAPISGWTTSLPAPSASPAATCPTLRWSHNARPCC